MLIKVCTTVVLLVLKIGYLEACNGYTYKVNYIRHCDANSVIQIPPNGFNINLDNDCNIIITGCAKVTKPFKTAKGTYSVKKAPLPPLEGDLDFCNVVQSTDLPVIKQFFNTMGVKKCPISAKNYCAAPNSKISIAQFKNQLGMGIGTATVKLDVEHDTGKSCIEFSGTLSKPKKG